MSLDILLKGQLAFLNKYYKVIAISGADEHLVHVATRENVKTLSVAMQRTIAPIKDIVSLIKIYNVLKVQKPLIIHSITPKAGLLSMTAAYFAGVPIRMHTFTGLLFPTKTGLMKQVLIIMDKLLCKFATHVYPEGEGVKKDLEKFKITKKPLKIIANGNVNGIDINYFSKNNFSDTENNKLKIKFKIKPNDFVFIFVGRIVVDKGINELIAAFIELSKTEKHCKLILVGPFEDEIPALQQATYQEIENNKQIISVGFQKDVRPWFAISNALVFPSYREGFPNVVLQAGAMELPSIVTDINGSNEIIENNNNGIVIPVKNKNAIFIAMKKMINEPLFIASLSHNARPFITTKYKQELVWNALLNEYKIAEETLLKKKSQS